jgi:predicted MPP superfamily phosphohydrolase
VLGQFVVHYLAFAGALIAPAALLATYFRLPRFRQGTLRASALLAAPYLFGVWAFLIEPQTLAVRHVEVASAEWIGAPLRIGVISDTHVGGPAMPPARMDKIVQRMNAERPDIVVLLGDYVVSDEPAELRTHPERAIALRGIASFAGLSAPRGVYAVIGNHDVWYDIGAIRTALQRANAVVLEDRAVPVPQTDAFVIGLNEYSMIGADYARASSGVPKGAPRIVIMHYPDSIGDVGGRATLALAGHTHCGQMGMPGLTNIVVASSASRIYRCGLYSVRGTPFYVTGGIGESILPMRLMAPPEIVVLTLKGAN